MDGPHAAGVIAVILKGYPRLSETFIAQELHALEERGLPLALYSLRHPTDRETHPIHGEIRAAVYYLPEYLHQEPLRVLRGWQHARRLSGYGKAVAAWWRDFRRDPTLNRIRRLGQALVLAAEMPDNVVALHAHFLHTPASVARYAALLRAGDLPARSQVERGGGAQAAGTAVRRLGSEGSVYARRSAAAAREVPRPVDSAVATADSAAAAERAAVQARRASAVSALVRRRHKRAAVAARGSAARCSCAQEA